MTSETHSCLQTLPVGHILHHRYRIIEQIATGGFSYVYRAEDIHTQESLIIKECAVEGMQYRQEDLCIHAQLEKDAPTLQRIVENTKDEAALLLKLTQLHIPGITQYIDSFEENLTTYIAMGEAKGFNLYEWSHSFKEQGIPFPSDFLVRILSSLLDILQQIHSIGYFHCDIKPDNIIIDESGSITLIDFGAARSVNKQHGEDVAISPGFSPPEFYPSHRGQIGAWTDLYMLAALIYHIITSRVPETADLRAVRDRNIPLGSLPELLNSYHPALLSSVDRAMNIKASERFASAEIWLKSYTQISSAPQLKRSTRSSSHQSAIHTQPSNLQIDNPMLKIKQKKKRQQLAKKRRNQSFIILCILAALLAAAYMYFMIRGI